MFFCNPCSWNYSAVRAVHLNGTTLKYCSIILLHSITRKFQQFKRVELHRTHEIFFYDPCFLHYSVVLAVRLCWSKEKLFFYPSSLNYSVVQAVLLGSTNSNSQNILLWTLFSQLHSYKSNSRGLNYTLNSWNIVLRSFFSQLLHLLFLSITR